jgi:hypothetical protein
MHDELMDDGNSSAAAEAALEARVIRALELGPELRISADFAARVAAQVPMRKPVVVTETHYGRNAMVIAMLVLFVALVAVASRMAGNSAFALGMEWILCAQFVAFGVWLGVRQWRVR